MFKKPQPLGSDSKSSFGKLVHYFSGTRVRGANISYSLFVDNSLPTVATGLVGVTVGRGFEVTLTFNEVLLFELRAVFTVGVVAAVLPAERTEVLTLFTDAPERAPFPVESVPEDTSPMALGRIVDVAVIAGSCTSWAEEFVGA